MAESALVLGAGSWGTALALLIAGNGRRVCLWDIDSDLIDALKRERCNRRYLPAAALPDNIIPLAAIEEAGADIRQIIIAVPCHALLSSLGRLHHFADIRVCLACKGFAAGPEKFNHRLVERELGCPVAVLSGPSFAGEVARRLPTAVALAAADETVASAFAELFQSDAFRVYTQDDPVGVQIGGAVKNVMAIAAGIADGLGYGANTRSALITRGLAEIMRLGLALGARRQTFMGLAGLGDLVLTCTDDQSRNRRLGLMLAQGHAVAAAETAIGQVVEGVKTAFEVTRLAADLAIEMPITEQVARVLNAAATPAEAVRALLTRDPRPEEAPNTAPGQ